MSLDEKFEEASEKVKKLTERPTNDELLVLYALFKQGTVGDNNTDKPGLLDMKGKAKWEAWKAKKGVSSEQAKQGYIDFVETLLAKYPSEK